MPEVDEGGPRAFSTFRVLTGDCSPQERDHLFRNMAQLFSYVSDRCDDAQVAEYDEVLCRLAGQVEVEARAHVAKLLAPLERAPGTVVVKLANDVFEVAKPLLEFSNVLSDDDLIDIATYRSEEHRVAIAGRSGVTDRVCEAIAEHGGSSSVVRLVRNENAELGERALGRLVERAGRDSSIVEDLRGRSDIDWAVLSSAISAAAARVLASSSDELRDAAIAERINAVVYNRLRNRAGFNSHEWKVAYNQVKALSDRKQLDERALARFVRFGYGHHTAAALTQQLRVNPEVFVKWLAAQDYVAMTVALRALGVDSELFDAVVAVMPWRDLPSEADRSNVLARFDALSLEEAQGIFELWRAHSFRKRNGARMADGAA